MRSHGWELPYHPLQTVAVAVFAALAFSFYVFFIPFVGNSVLKIHVMAAFSPVVILAFTLYVRCAACDPADPGVHRSKQLARAKKEAAYESKVVKMPVKNENNSDQSFEGSDRSASAILAKKSEGPKTGKSRFALKTCIPTPELQHTTCCRREHEPGSINPGEQLLYCSICEAEISKNSKHCRACDKCVYGFDHHCRWLNNCVGKKNYKSFVALMVSCLLLLIMLWATGIVVMVRCFSEKQSFDKEIAGRLGSSFSRVPFIVVVVLLSLLAMLATLPLMQLFFFHLILIHKGISTYDYIVAVREQEQGVRDGNGLNSLTSSPASSSASGYSSGGPLALHRGVFCTPPRMFVDHQQGILTVGSDLEIGGGRVGKGRGEALPKRPPVGINPWKLVRLSREDAAGAAARARENSSIVLPSRYTRGSSQVTETEDSSLDSSRSLSGEITVAGSRRGCRKHEAVYISAKERWLLMRERRDKKLSSNRDNTLVDQNLTAVEPVAQGLAGVIAPLPLEARGTFRCSPSRYSGELRASYPGSSYPGSSYPESQIASPDLRGSPELPVVNQVVLANSASASCDPDKVLLRGSASDGYEASGGESGDEHGNQCQRHSEVWSKLSFNPAFVNPTEKVGCSEDIVIPRTSLGSRSSRADSKGSSGGGTGSSGSRVEANILKHMKMEWPELQDQLSVSTDNSHSSSPTHYNSPQRDPSECQAVPDNTCRIETPDRKRSSSKLYDGPFSSFTFKAASGKKALVSTKKLKETILGMKRRTHSVNNLTELPEPTP